ncbi:hypothetical protein GCM10007897_21840 [Sphingobium jiangsuense]|uniref:Glycosyl hydrolase n=1 Tax=Sphingobium jiangsuense TaxID=870476 RepID=A0A7W6BLM6_9SPHN|nr:glycosyl hydrolase [Sphingobium jiangsuense]MBB3927392.1 hypothetical protein [Sphingobium jiangsuense]GLT00794.1 hypothetical protein GCM10007897_21840 [Sphingobium jiangsuense]
MLALLSCNGGVVTEGDGPPTRLLAATLHGIHIFERAPGGDWRLTGRKLIDHHISALALEPRSGLLFAGGHYDAGLWVSDDRGESWAPCNEGLESRHIYTLAVQQRPEGAVLWLGTEPPVLYKSTDLGRSWQALPGMLKVKNTDKWTFPPPPHVAHVKNIAFHPARPDDIYICIEQGALLKSADGGESWDEVTGYESGEDFFYNDNHRVLFRPSDPDDFLMNGGEGLYRCRHGQWTHLTTRDDRIGYPDAMFLDPRDENGVIMGGPQNAPRKWREQDVPMADPTVLYSADGGETWAPLGTGLPKITGNIEAMGMHVRPDGFSLYAGTATGEIFHSDDCGAHWSLLADRLPPISKGGHYRWFLSDERRAEIEAELKQQEIAAQG